MVPILCFRTAKVLKNVNEHVTVILVLHNLLIAFNDEWMIDEDEMETAEEEDINVVGEDIGSSGFELRLRVQNYLLQWYYTAIPIFN